MVQKSGVHQLRLVVFPIVHKVLAPSPVGFSPDFWTINIIEAIFWGAIKLGPRYNGRVLVAKSGRTLGTKIVKKQVRRSCFFLFMFMFGVFFLEGVIQMGRAFWGRNQKIIQMCMLILKKFPFFLCIFWGWE